MGWLFMGPALFGIWRYRYFAYWKWVLWTGAVLYLAGFLFWSNGTLADPSGDGLITGIVRRASGDGPEVLWVLLGLLAAVAVCFPLLHRAHLATKPPNPGREAAKRANNPRKIAETMGLIVAVLAANFIMGAVLYVVRATSPSVSAAVPLQQEPTVESQLADMARQVNGQVPQSLNDTVTLVGARVEGRTFVYQYTLNTDAQADVVRSVMSSEVIPLVCADANMTNDMGLGVTYRYEYQTARDQAVWFDVTPDVCATSDAQTIPDAP
jgi:hypothetical protein